MCGRFSLGVGTDRLIAEFGLDTLTTHHQPRYNIAPTQTVLAVVRGEDGLRLGALRWGLIPGWADTAAIGSRLINARSETVDRRPAFRNAFRHRRCWVLADGFYEWGDDAQAHAPDQAPDQAPAGRRPFYFHLPDGRPFAFAGLWDRWRGGGEDVVSCTILTTRPSDAVRPVHDRMPVLLPRGSRDAWLDPDASLRHLKALLRPYPGTLVRRPVSRAVNDPRRDGPACTAPAAGEGG